jgi:hypothetical protein
VCSSDLPPAINQFAKPLDRAEALPLFKLLAKYAPEDKAAKKDRLLEKAKRVASGGEALAGRHVRVATRPSFRRALLTPSARKYSRICRRAPPPRTRPSTT